MKKLSILILLIPFTSLCFAQKNYNSSVTTKYKTEGEIIEKSRTINVSDTEISISNFLGGTRTLILKVDKIDEKEYGWDGMSKWYFCTSTEKDIINDEYTKYIIIMASSYPSDMKVFQKVDEVTYIKTVFSLK